MLDRAENCTLDASRTGGAPFSNAVAVRSSPNTRRDKGQQVSNEHSERHRQWHVRRLRPREISRGSGWFKVHYRRRDTREIHACIDPSFRYLLLAVLSSAKLTINPAHGLLAIGMSGSCYA